MTSDPRVRRIRILILLGVLAVAAVVVAIALNSGGKDSSIKAKRQQVARQAGELDGIPQSALTLGDPGAPAELEEYLDLQCPFCAQFSREALPTVIEDFVRAGKLKVTLRPLAFIGRDSLTGARALLAASRQDKAFAFASSFYASQRPENSGYVTQEFLTQVGSAVRGLDSHEVIRQAQTNPSFTPTLKRITARAKKLGVTGSPTFFLTRDGGPPVKLTVDPNDYKASVTAVLGKALGQ